MNEIINFNNYKIRVNYKNNIPYFVAKDICDMLNISNASQAVKDLDDDEKCKMTNIILNNTYATQKTQLLLHVSESGFYSLILKSKKKEARKFQDFVFDELLPTLREKGNYSLENHSQNWLHKRWDGVGIEEAEIEVIQKFIDYAIAQGANKDGAKKYYATFTREVYKAINVQKQERNKISGMKLYQLSLLEMTIANSLLKSMEQEKHYKSAYKQAKEDFLQVAELAGFTVDNKVLGV